MAQQQGYDQQQGSQQPQQYPQQQPAQQPVQQQYPQQQPVQQQPVQQQQYPSQAQPLQQAAQQPPSSAGGFSWKYVIVGVLALIVIIAGLYFLMSGEEPEPVLTPIVTEPAAPTPVPVATPPVQQEFKIDKFLFASVINDDMTYTPKTGKTYLPGETVYIYLEPAGFEFTKEGSIYSMSLEEDVEVTDPDGYDISYMSGTGLVKVTENPSQDVVIWNEFNLLPDEKEGDYHIKIIVRDNLKGEEVVHEDTFIVKKEDSTSG